MERIVLEVSEASAKKWRYASIEKKQRIVKSIEQLIDQSLSKNDDDFWRFVDRISQKAADNGLTEEELGKILNEE